MPYIYYPTNLFMKNDTTTGYFTDQGRGALDWNPDTYAPGDNTSYSQLKVDRNATGIDGGTGAISTDPVTFLALVFPFYHTSWNYFNIRAYADSTYVTGRIVYSGISFSSMGADTLTIITTFASSDERYWMVESFPNGVALPVAMFAVGQYINLPRFSWGDESALYALRGTAAGADGIAQGLIAKSDAYQYRILTFEYLTEAELLALRGAYRRCCGSGLPFFFMEDDAGNKNNDSVLMTFVPGGFQYSYVAHDLANATITVRQVPRIPPYYYLNSFRRPF